MSSSQRPVYSFGDKTVVFIVFLMHIKKFSFLFKMPTLIKLFAAIHTVHHIHISYFLHPSLYYAILQANLHSLISFRFVH